MSSSLEGFSVDLVAVTGASGRVARLADQAHGLSGTVTACGDGLAGASDGQILSGTLTALTDRWREALSAVGNGLEQDSQRLRRAVHNYSDADAEGARQAASGN